jgi:signal transduction histidine kinase
MIENYGKQELDFELIQRKIDIILDLEEDLILILNGAGIITKVNAKGAHALDFQEKGIVNSHIIDMIVTKYKPEAMKAFNDIIEGKPERTFEAAIYTFRGDEILYNIKARPIHNEGKIDEIVLVGKNISYTNELKAEIEKLKVKLIEADRLIAIERQRGNQRKSFLEELNKMKSDFVSNISHELRTPLASIIGFSETIDSDPDMPEAMKSEFNTTILNEGKRLARLINDILDISKLEGGGIEISSSKFDIIIMLNELIEVFRKSAEAKGIKLSSEIPEVEIFIDADKERISQTIGRLLSNAIKFTNEGGRVKVIAKNLFKEIEIIISDTGIGIPEKDLPYIFQKFYRVNRPGTEIPGTGLGLVFVKQIINLHRGFITVQSDAGKGTTFAIKLPKIIYK